VTIGARVTLEQMMDLCSEVSQSFPNEFAYVDGLRNHIDKIANLQVRNVSGKYMIGLPWKALWLRG